MTRDRHKDGFAAGVAVTLLSAAVIVGGLFLAKAPPRESRVDLEGRPIMGSRTVLVGATTGEMSQPGKPLYTVLTEGTRPAAPTTATVVSDENCAPNRAGVSHCTNRLRMADGSMMTVMHPHRMSQVPCLSPGEVVNVRAA